MTFADWLQESKQRFQQQPPTTAAIESGKRFVRGAVRRSVDPYVGTSIWDRDDWDVLIVADAARVDMTRLLVGDYENFPDATGVERVWSNASCSIDWIVRNWVDQPEETRRTAYVTANPFADHSDPDARSADLRDEQIGELRLLYETEWEQVVGGLETVQPMRVTDHAIDVWRRRDELGIDRMVVHYMQPHEPFRSRPEWASDHDKLLKNLVDEDAAAGSSVYSRVRDGDIPLEELRYAYKDNHRWLFEDVNGLLLRNLEADHVVLTADHANGLDEFGAWHHPPGRIHPAVRTVPWLRVEASDHRTIEPDIGSVGTVTETEKQLQALGYR